MRESLKVRAEALAARMTLEEKIGMIHGAELFATKGVERLGIPPLRMSDSTMGVRQEFEPDSWKAVGLSDDFVTYLPCCSALAATWNRTLAYETGSVLGEEARGRGKDVILGPGINIKRSPLCGRNFEYFSEDPYLTGELAAPFIRGVQKWDVAACVKHFAANNQETERLWVEVSVDEEVLRAIYLPAFYDAIKAGGALTIMGAYNRLYGEHCCQSDFLLRRILREEWGYDGVVISDWGGVHDTELAAKSQLDIEMSVTSDFDQYKMAEPLREMVERGQIPEKVLDEKVVRILMLMMKLHMLDGERKSGSYNTEEHRQTALKAARESVVLLKNEKGILPLDEKKCWRILVVGENAEQVHGPGGGSGEIKALYEITPLMGIKKLLGGNCQVDFVPGYCRDGVDQSEAAETLAGAAEGEGAGAPAGTAEGEAAGTSVGAAEGEKSGAPAGAEVKKTNWQETSLEHGGGAVKVHREDPAAREQRRILRQQAVEAASRSCYDQVIFVGGLNHDYDSEGNDRADMKLPYEQDQLIGELLTARPDMVVVLLAGSPVEMGEWIDRADSLVWCWYGGMEGGTALAEVLFGRVNPSGKLPESFYKSHRDCSAHCVGEFPGTDRVCYREGVFVGYRYLDTFGVEPEFCFGHGLSYTEFSYGKARLEWVEPEAAKEKPEKGEGLTEELLGAGEAGKGKSEAEKGKSEAKGDEKILAVVCEITNRGACAGKEVAQVYLRQKIRDKRAPYQELAGFEKVELEPGETKTVRIWLRGNPEGKEIAVGSSSKDIRAVV